SLQRRRHRYWEGGNTRPRSRRWSRCRCSYPLRPCRWRWWRWERLPPAPHLDPHLQPDPHPAPPTPSRHPRPRPQHQQHTPTPPSLPQAPAHFSSASARPYGWSGPWRPCWPYPRLPDRHQQNGRLRRRQTTGAAVASGRVRRGGCRGSGTPLPAVTGGWDRCLSVVCTCAAGCDGWRCAGCWSLWRGGDG
ncbi:hypothetical protein DFP73DRAFT_634836, partial [Morchella snyderi]